MEARRQKEDQKVQEAIASTSDEAKQIDAIAAIRKWFYQDGDSQHYPLVQSYLDGNADLPQTANKITEPIDAAITANSLEEFPLMDLWYSILHSSKRTPFCNTESHNKLIELLKSIKSHQAPAEASDQNRSTYENLDGFGLASRETMNDSPGVGAGYSVPEAHAYANLNYFFARLTGEGIFDFWIYCIYNMRDALENVQQDDGPNDAHRPGTAVQKYDARAPAAAVWVFALGKKLYRKEEDLTPTSPNQGNPAKGGKLWEGKPGFSKERWALWKKRFGEISQMEEVSEETRKVAAKAFDAMNEAEQS